MNNNPQNPEEAVICYCSGTTQAKIKALLANDVDTLEKIANETGATTGCGACDYLVLELIAQNNAPLARPSAMNKK